VAAEFASRRDKALGERDSDLAYAPGAGDEEAAIPPMDGVCEGSKRGRDMSPGPFGTKGL
jgi:hypothetical protein